MFPLSRLLRTGVKKGDLTVIDADGKRHQYGDGTAPRVVLKLHDEKLYRSLVYNSEIAAGEGYMDGRITLEEGTSIRDFLALYTLNQNSIHNYPVLRMFDTAAKALRRFQQSNRIGEARKNVAHHYDIGNAFYKLFLDKNLLYSCAYYRSKDDSLETAQRNKLRLLASKLNLRPGQKVLDIGSGWGDLAIYLAQLEEVEVTGVTLSEEQCELSNARAHELGLSNRVRFELKDYRLLDERFDRIVSVGMFEHVGVQHYGEFFGKVKAMMPEDGVTVLHSIGHITPPGITSPWIHKYIFPGAYAPALSEVFSAVERERLWVLDLEFLRLHYAMTLRDWGARFQKNRDKVVKMFDERFARMWEFYLAGAEMMFRNGAQMVFHMQFSPSRDAVPLQRDYIIEKQREYEEKEAELGIAV